jgi:hypothetical protein
MNQQRLKKFFKKLFYKTMILLPTDLEAKGEASNDKRLKKNCTSDLEHLRTTLEWLIQAQNINTDGGVARAYKAAK